MMANRFRLLISTGEVSGDLQGGLLIQTLHTAAAARGWQLDIQALGGPKMAESGASLIANTTSLGAIGLIEAIPYLPTAWMLQQQLRQQVQQQPPDLTVLIDYPGFNLALAGYLKQHRISPVLYYIAPQEWIWSFSQRTTQQIVARTDQILAIFQQEAEYYAAHGAKAIWVGHPLVEAVAHYPSRTTARQQLGIPDRQTAITLLPASRPQELKYILPTLAAAAQQIQTQVAEAHFWVPIALESFRTPIQATIQQLGLRATLTDQPQLALAAADLAIGKSGTANLEAALLEVPQIVLYRVHPINGWLYRKLLRFKVPFISPVNLVRQMRIVPELLQDAATPAAISQLALTLLQPAERSQMIAQYHHLRTQLGPTGATQRAANAILNCLSPNHPG
jgi:lipid-A-disaccharide synthase